jgi:hypothetical protein
MLVEEKKTSPQEDSVTDLGFFGYIDSSYLLLL